MNIQRMDKRLLKKQMDCITKSKDIPRDIKEGLLNMLTDMYNEIGRVYDITSVTKEDIEVAWEGHDKFSKSKLKKVSDAEMCRLAEKMADQFCNCCFWVVLRERTRDSVLKR